MSEEKIQPVVIRRIKKIKKNGHHSGSWKIAYADFVTAMMAFFLLMWLLGLMNKYQLAGIAEYFKKPLKDAFTHDGNQRNRDKNVGKEKNKEKETQTQKPDKVDDNPQQDKKNLGKTDVPKKSLEEMKAELENKLQTDPKLSEFKNQLNFTVTADGLKIELHDLENKPMFTKGMADFQKNSKVIITWLSNELNNYPNRVVIIGHTDAAPYDDDNYTNWELSADRANATRRELVKNGMNPEKIIRVVGLGDTDLLDKQNGLNPANRRIEIIIMTDDAMKKLTVHH